ncbi:MAG: SidA/IucD/PvdA family monooxygenase [Thermoanaerobaculia bacterium]|nr:SidA/IucD/PvdA family monooxygenase [Thermoanaerobaculia bacterium]
MTPYPRDDRRAQVLVVGAGPYGIAVAQELHCRGLDVVVIGRPFETWHRHTLDVMNLRSDPRGSSVWSPDARFDFPTFLRRIGHTAGEHDIVPVSLFRRYLSEVEHQLPFPVVQGIVEELASGNDGYGFEALGRLDSRTKARQIRSFRVSADVAVIATGLGSHRHLPAAFRELPADRVAHSWDTERIQATRSRRVLVVGTGQSAAESVLSLTTETENGPANEVSWAVKRPPLFFREPLRLPTPLFKLVLAGSHLIYRLPPPILRTLGKATFRTTITPTLKRVWLDPSVEKLTADAEGLGLTLEASGIRCRVDGRLYDQIVSATGYRYSLLGLPFLSDPLASRLGGADKPPALAADFSCAVPDLYLVGGIAEPTHGPAMRFVLGARHAARRVGERLEARFQAQAA